MILACDLVSKLRVLRFVAKPNCAKQFLQTLHYGSFICFVNKKSCLITNNYSKFLMGLIACLHCEDWLRIIHGQYDGHETTEPQRSKCTKLAKQMSFSRNVGLNSITNSHRDDSHYQLNSVSKHNWLHCGPFKNLTCGFFGWVHYSAHDATFYFWIAAATCIELPYCFDFFQ